MKLLRNAISKKSYCLILMCALGVAGCGSSSDKSSSAAGTGESQTQAKVQVKGVSGLGQITLTSTSGEKLTVTQDGTYQFKQTVSASAGVVLRVLVETASTDTVCSPANGSGLQANGTVYQSNIVCAASAQSFWIGGRVEGLETRATFDSAHPRQQVIISDNGGTPLVIDQDGNYHFPQQIPYNGSYQVLINQQPTQVVCSVRLGEGSGVVRNVMEVDMGCSYQSYTLGGTVSGLSNGQTVTLSDGINGTPLVIDANGKFQFPIHVPLQGDYSVTVVNQTAGNICTVANSRGHGVTGNVDNINVTCTPESYNVGGTVTGLTSQQQVTLQNNGGDDLTLSSNQTFTFTTPVAYGSSYSVTVNTQPTGSTCTVQYGSGSDVVANVSTVLVNCAPSTHTFVEKTLYQFKGGLDGLNPNGGLIADSAGNLYGVTASGGKYNYGTVYKLTPTASDYTEQILYSFSGDAIPNSPDGMGPGSQLVMDHQGNLFGTAGSSNAGIVFELSPTVTGYKETILYSFTQQSDGAFPSSGLVMDSAGNLYGATYGNYVNGVVVPGTVYKLSPSGNGYIFSVVHGFISSGWGGSEGAQPEGNLVIDNAGNIYGTTMNGGTNGTGIAFELSPTSTGYTETILHTFGATGDGENPDGGLTSDSAGNLYGTTESGSVSSGTVFKLSPSGNGYTETILYSFSKSANGATPVSGVLVDGAGNLYGTTTFGGTAGGGVIFMLNPATTNYSITNLYNGPGQGQTFGNNSVIDNAGNIFGAFFGSYPGNPGFIYELVLQ